ncbi:OmpA family protein [Candidatus Methylomirabilis sp.]|uniref:OmpA family protein n=1 Tax=Candidatus Methylomirabilis sp. TaxID=2032687 RepID=UPI003C79285A
MKRLMEIWFLLLLAAPGYAAGPDFSSGGMDWGDLYFSKGSAELSAEARQELAELAGWLKKHPDAMVLLAGYDDQRTPEKDSTDLGWNRTKAVQGYLSSRGVDAGKVNAISFGNTRGIVAGQGEAVWAKNRRVRYRAVESSPGTSREDSMGGVCQRCKKK